jgi:hypothetical protein
MLLYPQKRTFFFSFSKFNLVLVPPTFELSYQKLIECAQYYAQGYR